MVKQEADALEYLLLVSEVVGHIRRPRQPPRGPGRPYRYCSDNPGVSPVDIQHSYRVVGGPAVARPLLSYHYYISRFWLKFTVMTVCFMAFSASFVSA